MVFGDSRLPWFKKKVAEWASQMQQLGSGGLTVRYKLIPGYRQNNKHRLAPGTHRSLQKWHECVSLTVLSLFFWRCDYGFPSKSRVRANWPAPARVPEKTVAAEPQAWKVPFGSLLLIWGQY